VIIGIDPGVKGGLCLMTDGGLVVETISLTGLKEKEVTFALAKWSEVCDDPPAVFIEKVGHIRGDGAGGSFTFGAVFGLLRGIVLGLGWNPRYVYPMMWQSALNCLSGGNKNVTKGMAISLFPDYHAKRPRGIVHDIADSILIAEYGRRTLARRQ
jgi:hypothetical protein